MKLRSQLKAWSEALGFYDGIYSTVMQANVCFGGEVNTWHLNEDMYPCTHVHTHVPIYEHTHEDRYMYLHKHDRNIRLGSQTWTNEPLFFNLVISKLSSSVAFFALMCTTMNEQPDPSNSRHSPGHLQFPFTSLRWECLTDYWLPGQSLEGSDSRSISFKDICQIS